MDMQPTNLQQLMLSCQYGEMSSEECFQNPVGPMPQEGKTGPNPILARFTKIFSLKTHMAFLCANDHNLYNHIWEA